MSSNYEVAGSGPLIVLSPGLADLRQSYRHLVPLLVAGGYRVASVDLRGHGDAPTGQASFTRADTAEDLIEVVRTLGGPAVIVGQSFSGGAATIAAATQPDLVRAIVEIGPFTRTPAFDFGAFWRNDHNYRRGTLLLGWFALTGRVDAWVRYLDLAYPSGKPADWESYVGAVRANLAEPARLAAARAMLTSGPSDAAAQLANVTCPTLIVMGSADSDFADPRAEASGIVDALPSELGEYVMIEGAGHYPHAERPDEVATAILDFLRRRVDA